MSTHCGTKCLPSFLGKKCRARKQLACECDSRFFATNPAIASDCIAFANATNGKGSIKEFECQNAERIFQATGISFCDFNPNDSFMFQQAELERAEFARREADKKKVTFAIIGLLGLGLLAFLIALIFDD